MDRIDNAILVSLQNQGRMSNKELAAAVGLAPSSCLERVRRLQDRGIITGFHADVDPAAMGIRLQAFVSVRLAHHNREVLDGFRDHVAALPEVVSLYHVAGQDDFMIHVAVRDAEHLKTLTLEDFTTRAEVARIHTALVYEHISESAWPNYNVQV